jgi:hypothetical protein
MVLPSSSAIQARRSPLSILEVASGVTRHFPQTKTGNTVNDKDLAADDDPGQRDQAGSDQTGRVLFQRNLRQAKQKLF